MKSQGWVRICDMCGSNYNLNGFDIPRVIVTKRINVDDITSKDIYAEPDYCDLCIKVILKMLQKRRQLSFHISELLINRIPNRE